MGYLTDKMGILKPIIKDAGILFGSRIVGLVLGFVANAIVARYLGPSKYGTFKVIISLSFFLLPIFDFGIFSSIGYMLANSRDEDFNKKLIGASVVLSIFIGILFSFTFIIIFKMMNVFTNKEVILDKWFLIGIPLIISMPFQGLIYQIAKGLRYVKLASVFQLINSGLFFLMVVVLGVIKNMKVSNLALSFFGANFIASAVSVYLVSPSLSRNLWTILDKIFKTVRIYGIKMYLGQITANVGIRIDPIVLAALRGNYEVGLYGVAFLLTVPIVSLSQSISLIAFRSLAEDISKLKTYETVNYIWLLFAIFVLIFIGPYALNLIFGEKYSAVGNLLPFVALMAFFQGGYQIKGALLAARGYGKETLIASLVMTGTELSTIFMFTYLWGAAGTALSMALTYLSYWIMMQIFAKKLEEGDGIRDL